MQVTNAIVSDAHPLNNEAAISDRSTFARSIRVFESVLDRFASLPVAVIIVFSLIYLVPTSLIAARKLLWDDEFFTLYISTVSGWHELLRALSTGADQHPPTFYYLTHLVLNTFGTNHVTLRLPAIFGFWLMCVLLYLLSRQLSGGVWGILTMLLPLTSKTVYYYASEGRGYDLMLGFFMLALFSWMNAARGSRRRLFIPLLGASLAAAVGSHYYAVLTAFALALGELVRVVMRSKVDFPIALAFCAAALPLVPFLSTIRDARSYSEHFWAAPAWQMILEFYPVALQGVVNVFLIALACGIFSLRRRNQPSIGTEQMKTALPTWSLTA